MRKKIFLFISTVTLCNVLCSCVTNAQQDKSKTIDNSSLIPEIKDDSQVKFELSSDGSKTVDWVKSLIIVEANPLSASESAKLSGMTKALDHLSEMGVNAIWITPINKGRHYWNYGIHTVTEKLSGEKEIPKRWKQVRNFVDQAHKRNIRVFLDVVSWGVRNDAPLYKKKPEWFTGPSKPAYKGWNWNWKNKELNEWFSSRLTEMILMSGADGFRCDSSPRYAGYAPYRVAKKRLLDLGHKIVLIGEHASDRKGVFDFNQLAFIDKRGKTYTRKPVRVFLTNNIVDLVKSGKMLGSVDHNIHDGGQKRFYSFSLSCHDNREAIHYDPITFGYQALFSPFIPIWYLGESWNNPKVTPGWKWRNPVDWKKKEQNREFFEQVKQMIRIRRQYPHIFEYFPDDHRNSNICKVKTNHPKLLQAYARYKDGDAIIIVPNSGEKTETFKISVSLKDIDFDSALSCKISDLLNNNKLSFNKTVGAISFSANIKAGMLGLFLISQGK